MSRCGHREERNIYWAEWRKIMVLSNVWLSFVYGTMRSYISYQAPMSVTKEKWKKRWVSFLGLSSNLTTSNSNSLLCLTPHPGLFQRTCSQEHSTINYLHIRVCFSWNLTGDIELSISSGRAGHGKFSALQILLSYPTWIFLSTTYSRIWMRRPLLRCQCQKDKTACSAESLYCSYSQPNPW